MSKSGATTPTFNPSLFKSPLFTIALADPFIFGVAETIRCEDAIYSHLRLYVFAERFNIPKLKEAIIPDLFYSCNIDANVDQLCLTDSDCLDLLIPVINYAFDHIPRPASGTLPSVLRVLTDWIGFNLEKFRIASDFRQWMLDRPDIAYDIIRGLNRRRTTPNPLIYEQPPHILLRRCLTCHMVKVAVVSCPHCDIRCLGKIALVSGNREKWFACIPKPTQTNVTNRKVIYKADRKTSGLCCDKSSLKSGDSGILHEGLSCGNLRCEGPANLCYPD